MTLSNEFQAKAERPWIKSYPAGIKWDAEIPVTTMVKMLNESIEKYGDRVAFSISGREFTYKQLGDMSDRFAANLQKQGVGQGKRVGLALPNTPFYIVAYYGALKAGATVANFNPLYPEAEMKHLVADSGCEFMVTVDNEKVLPTVNKVQEAVKTLKKIIVCQPIDLAGEITFDSRKERLTARAGYFYHSIASAVKGLFDRKHIAFATMLAGSAKKLKPVDISPDDVALLQFSGGTTGLPKAAMLSHGNLSANLAQAKMWFGKDKADDQAQEKMLVLLPFYHVFAMTVQMNLTFATGGELMMTPPGKPDLNAVLKMIDQDKPTMFAGVPTVYTALLENKNLVKYDLSSVNLWLIGGGGPTQALADGWKARTGKEFVEGYGMSESSPLAIANPIGVPKKPGSCGKPVPGTDIHFLDINTGEECATNVDGELCVSGPQVMKGYLNRPVEEQTVDSQGRLHTGDIGHMDEDGDTFIVDRLKDMIKTSGLNVYPRDVEEAIAKHPAVARTVVIGVPDARQGESVKAFIVFKDPANPVPPADMKAFLKESLVSYKVPSQFEYRESLPLTQLGKPDKKALKAEEKAKVNKAAPAPTPPQGPAL